MPRARSLTIPSLRHCRPPSYKILKPNWRFLHLEFSDRDLDFLVYWAIHRPRPIYVTFSGPGFICVTFFRSRIIFLLLFRWKYPETSPGDLVRTIIVDLTMLLFRKSAIWDFLRKTLNAKIPSLVVVHDESQDVVCIESGDVRTYRSRIR